MAQQHGSGERWQPAKLAFSCLLALSISSCALVQPDIATQLETNARLIADIKTFGKTLGIEPTGALSRTVREQPVLSMLWVWMQRDGTLALDGPVDIRMAIGFTRLREDLKLEQIYQVDGYSVYYRQANEFADSRSVATVGFAEEGVLRRVHVVLHEDLHGDENFALPWEIEEAIITPLSSLAAVEFFRHKGDPQHLAQALASLEEERQLARELNALVAEAEKIFKTETVEKAKTQILNLMPSYPAYHRRFQRQTKDQHPATVLEAKLSHDLGYYRYLDQIVALSEKVGNLKVLIDDFKKLPQDTSQGGMRVYLQQLNTRYDALGTPIAFCFPLA
ncbi:MAG TPA: hypothetical protein VEG60_19805 [Candidatus Binatia bacterium]|nr:hypothetical protein [Candidatus Binatia bacterium]